MIATASRAVPVVGWLVPDPLERQRVLYASFRMQVDLDEVVNARRPATAHHHLALLAVDPDRQRRGLGGALLGWYHHRLDTAGLPAYVEASSAASRRLYLRHGTDHDHHRPARQRTPAMADVAAPATQLTVTTPLGGADMTGPDRSRRPSRADLLPLGSHAQAILRWHQPDEMGLCTGCLDQWSLLVRYPCGQARWADAVDQHIPTTATLALLGIAPEPSHRPPAATHWRRGDEEGTVMALAALGDPARFRPLVHEAIPLTGSADQVGLVGAVPDRLPRLACCASRGKPTINETVLEDPLANLGF